MRARRGRRRKKATKEDFTSQCTMPMSTVHCSCACISVTLLSHLAWPAARLCLDSPCRAFACRLQSKSLRDDPLEENSGSLTRACTRTSFFASIVRPSELDFLPRAGSSQHDKKLCSDCCLSCLCQAQASSAVGGRHEPMQPLSDEDDAAVPSTIRSSLLTPLLLARLRSGSSSCIASQRST